MSPYTYTCMYEDVFTLAEKKGNVIFFKSVTFAFNISESFPFVKEYNWNSFFDMVWINAVEFILLFSTPSNLTLEINFYVGKQENVTVN